MPPDVLRERLLLVLFALGTNTVMHTGGRSAGDIDVPALHTLMNC